MARSTSASQPRRSRTRLQPGQRPSGSAGEPDKTRIAPIKPGLLAEAEAEALNSGEELSRNDRASAKRAAANLARRNQDLEKINALALQGFTGPDYDIFAGELAAYSYPVILAWLRRGVIYKYCADRGRPVSPSDTDRELLAGSPDERLQLALETVTEALTFFRDHVLRRQRWSHAGGASITTYFIGACLFTFPNVFRRWQSEQHKWRQALAIEMLHCPGGCSATLVGQPGADPADLITSRAAVIDELNTMTPGERAAAALIIDGDNFAEAAERLGTTDRGVEGRLYRYRSRTRQNERKGEGR